ELVGEVLLHLVRRIDKDLSGHAVEPPLDALALRARADHVEVKVAGGAPLPAQDRPGGDNPDRIVISFQDVAHSLAQRAVIRLIERRKHALRELACEFAHAPSSSASISLRMRCASAAISAGGMSRIPASTISAAICC